MPHASGAPIDENHWGDGGDRTDQLELEFQRAAAFFFGYDAARVQETAMGGSLFGLHYVELTKALDLQKTYEALAHRTGVGHLPKSELFLQMFLVYVSGRMQGRSFSDYESHRLRQAMAMCLRDLNLLHGFEIPS